MKNKFLSKKMCKTCGALDPEYIESFDYEKTTLLIISRYLEKAMDLDLAERRWMTNCMQWLSVGQVFYGKSMVDLVGKEPK